MLVMQHFFVSDLVVCWAITKNFYHSYQVTNVSRGIIMFIQLLCFAGGPMACFAYAGASMVFFSKLSEPTRTRFITKSFTLRDALIDPIPTGNTWLDTSRYPPPFGLIVAAVLFVVGVTSALAVFGIYLVVVMPVLLFDWIVSCQKPMASAVAGVLAAAAWLVCSTSAQQQWSWLNRPVGLAVMAQIK